MPKSQPPLLLLAALLLLLPATSAFARSSQDRVSVGNDITVNEGETVGDVACAFCSVHVHGDVRGDIAVAFGSVTIDSGRTISGDIAVFAGDVNVADETHIGGDVAIAGGDLNLAPSASVHGDRAVFPGRFWILIPLAPLIILIGIIWLVVYLVRRNRYQFPVYPNGRRV
ncbi:MAG: hypothetical protein JWM43_2024 [Acidobacteriaceae bacterium]|nr:hypothetical protein [Acidobacteriaceae bacterium]